MMTFSQSGRRRINLLNIGMADDLARIHGDSRFANLPGHQSRSDQQQRNLPEFINHIRLRLSGRKLTADL